MHEKENVCFTVGFATCRLFISESACQISSSVVLKIKLSEIDVKSRRNMRSAESESGSKAGDRTVRFGLLMFRSGVFGFIDTGLFIIRRFKGSLSSSEFGEIVSVFSEKSFFQASTTRPKS